MTVLYLNTAGPSDQSPTQIHAITGTAEQAEKPLGMTTMTKGISSQLKTLSVRTIFGGLVG